MGEEGSRGGAVMQGAGQREEDELQLVWHYKASLSSHN